MSLLQRVGVAALLSLFATPAVTVAQTTTITLDHARFEFLTPSLVRMEYVADNHFLDAPSAVAQKRDWPAVDVRREQRDGWLELRSKAITLRYHDDGKPFDASNLQLSWQMPDGSARSWRPGQSDPQNLGGLTYSLDHVSGSNLGSDDRQSPHDDIIPGIDIPLLPAKPGLLSRNGYALIDDSSTPAWNATTQWITPRAQPYGQDWYLFAYGDDYRNVLQTYAQLCGSVPMVPRWVLGNWVTDFNFEYFPDTADAHDPVFQHYNQQHLEQELEQLRQAQIPFDALVLDFAWHNYGWQGGYDWSPLISDPKQFLQWLRERGIKLSLNDHPGYAGTEESILAYEDSHAPAALAALGKAQPAKPDFAQNIASGWVFQTDPHDQGLQQQWFAEHYNVRDWKPIRTDQAWLQQGYPAYQGVAWYRTTVTLPSTLPDTLYLYLGEVGQTYRAFINGHEVKHDEVQWPRRLTYSDVRAYLRPGQPNTIALRVLSGERGAGLTRGPVALVDTLPPPRIYFDLANQRQADIFMQQLHAPLMKDGVAAWWVDGGGGAAYMAGLNPQLWTNKVFYDASQQITGERGFILSRYGDWGSERYPAFFTGDTYSQWSVLAYEVAFSARGGNVLVPYISHDIGGFHGAKIDFDLYARWIEFGAFSAILRMHSAHANPREGNARMPWLYGEQGVALMRKYFQLRTQLIPYIYSYSWQAHTQSLPLLRPLYLAWPQLDEAYKHAHEYLFGNEMLVAPVTDASGNVDVYLPAGRWFDFFSGKAVDGGRSINAHYAVDQIPVFVRDGAIIPEQPQSAWSDQKPLDTLLINIYGSGSDHFQLYEDDGRSLAYQHGAYAITAIDHQQRDGRQQLTIAPAKGSYQGQPLQRTYVLLIHAEQAPQQLQLNGHAFTDWQWDQAEHVARVSLPRQAISSGIAVSWH